MLVLHGSPWFSLYADCVASLNFVPTKPGSPHPKHCTFRQWSASFLKSSYQSHQSSERSTSMMPILHMLFHETLSTFQVSHDITITCLKWYCQKNMDSIMMSPYKEASTAVKRVCIQKRIHVHSSMITYMQMNKNPGAQTMRIHRQTHLESTGELQHLCRLKICNTLLEFFCTCEPVSCAPCACVW